MKRTEQLLEALGNVGVDLVETAEDVVKIGKRWGGILSAAACLTVLLGLGAAAMHGLPGQTAAEPPEVQTHALVDPMEEAPEVSVTIPEEDPPEQEETKEEWPVYLVNSQLAVSGAGEVLVSLEQGYLEILTDKATGEPLAIVAFDRTDTAAGENDTITFYDFDGNLCHVLTACNVEVTGDTVVIGYADHAALYDRSDRSLIREDLTTAWVVRDLVIGISMEDPDYYLVRRDTEPMLGYIRIDAVERIVEHENGVQFVYRENGLLGLMDADGTMRVAPDYDEITKVDRQWMFGRQGEVWFAVNWQTGQALELFRPQQLWEGGAVYEDVQNPGCMLFATFSYDEAGRITDWQVHTEPCVAIEVVDDEGNGVPELLVAMEKRGHYAVWHPDGMLLNRIEAAQLTVVNSHTAIGKRVTDNGEEAFFLVDLLTGDERHEFEKDYSYGQTLFFPNYEEGIVRPDLFYATYYDESGEHVDLLTEDGTVVLENLATYTDPCLGDAFLCGSENTVRLVWVDGTVIYEAQQAEAGVRYAGEILREAETLPMEVWGEDRFYAYLHTMDDGLWLETVLWIEDPAQPNGYRLEPAGEDCVFDPTEDCQYWILQSHWSPYLQIPWSGLLNWKNSAGFDMLFRLWRNEEGSIIAMAEVYQP